MASHMIFQFQKRYKQVSNFRSRAFTLHAELVNTQQLNNKVMCIWSPIAKRINIGQYTTSA